MTLLPRPGPNLSPSRAEPAHPSAHHLTQVAFNFDDGVEMFGGTVDMKYVSIIFCGMFPTVPNQCPGSRSLTRTRARTHTYTHMRAHTHEHIPSPVAFRPHPSPNPPHHTVGDDGFDTDLGYAGRTQFLFVVIGKVTL